ncbi:hypothetical protein EIN_056980 [Entamoeba invadens IP1]|uniref:hypothetical protein n=1 Tax=Entamoeba invadens IP1 TaxID=370355 RepID=UPI0002C3EB10|nr:hypothetical protein EIN_056980 [Entamoeba invadens IP1]ELP93313.1 hypothetical protein EIN_056980 [Entamoeba invadens IP1]|eukprot:XP_004260084.1 hypothetical protein EIN_056980 [Entamoeba invadens IP1]
MDSTALQHLTSVFVLSRDLCEFLSTYEPSEIESIGLLYAMCDEILHLVCKTWRGIQVEIVEGRPFGNEELYQQCGLLSTSTESDLADQLADARDEILLRKEWLRELIRNEEEEDSRRGMRLGLEEITFLMNDKLDEFYGLVNNPPTSDFEDYDVEKIMSYIVELCVRGPSEDEKSEAEKIEFQVQYGDAPLLKIEEFEKINTPKTSEAKQSTENRPHTPKKSYEQIEIKGKMVRPSLKNMKSDLVWKALDKTPLVKTRSDLGSIGVPKKTVIAFIPPVEGSQLQATQLVESNGIVEAQEDEVKGTCDVKEMARGDTPPLQSKCSVLYEEQPPVYSAKRSVLSRKQSEIALQTATEEEKGNYKLFEQRFTVINQFLDDFEYQMKWAEWFNSVVYCAISKLEIMSELDLDTLFSRHIKVVPLLHGLTEPLQNMNYVAQVSSSYAEDDMFYVFMDHLNQYFVSDQLLIEAIAWKGNANAMLRKMMKNPKFKELAVDGKNNLVETFIQFPELMLGMLVQVVLQMYSMTPDMKRTWAMEKVRINAEDLRPENANFVQRIRAVKELQELEMRITGFMQCQSDIEKFVEKGRHVVQRYPISMVVGKKYKRMMLYICNDIAFICSQPEKKTGYMKCVWASKLERCTLILQEHLEAKKDIVNQVVRESVHTKEMGEHLKTLKNARVPKAEKKLDSCCVVEYIKESQATKELLKWDVVFWSEPESNVKTLRVALINAIGNRKAEKAK